VLITDDTLILDVLIFGKYPVPPTYKSAPIPAPPAIVNPFPEDALVAFAVFCTEIPP
jgi:hypothetical protein